MRCRCLAQIIENSCKGIDDVRHGRTERKNIRHGVHRADREPRPQPGLFPHKHRLDTKSRVSVELSCCPQTPRATEIHGRRIREKVLVFIGGSLRAPWVRVISALRPRIGFTVCVVIIGEGAHSFARFVFLDVHPRQTALHFYIRHPVKPIVLILIVNDM